MRVRSPFPHALHLFFAFLLSLAAAPSPAQFTWSHVPIGGGGYVTGAQCHPTSPDTSFIWTDVGGAYRWNASAQAWQSLSGWVTPEASNIIGVDGFAAHPQRPATLVAALGKYPAFDGGGLYKSTDSGATWTLLRSTRCAANSSYRWLGNAIAFDPLHPQSIYAGTRTEGLLVSRNEGGTWSAISSVPKGHIGSPNNYWADPPIGIRAVLVDPSESLSGRSRTVYAAVRGSGVFRSTDAGSSFSLIAGSPTDCNRIDVAGGRLWVTTDRGVSAWQNGSWQAFQPGGTARPFNALTVDRKDPRRVVVAGGEPRLYETMFRSMNGGATWTEIHSWSGTARVEETIPWRAGNGMFFLAATASLALDPHRQGHAFFSDWYSVWHTENLWTTPVVWRSRLANQEATVILTLSCPPSGAPLFSGLADVVGFRHAKIDAYPTARLTATAECTAIDFCEANPNHLAMIDATDWYGANTRILRSSDNGISWTATATSPPGLRSGRLAVSSANANRIVYLPAGDSHTPYFTADGGATWRASQGVSNRLLPDASIFRAGLPLAADRTQGNRFYLFDATAGHLLSSTDNGATWSKRNSTALPAPGLWATVCLASDTGKGAGALWLAADSGGLWFSSNRGQTFSRIAGFDSATAVALGAPLNGSASSTVFVLGRRTGGQGLFFSSNSGASWTEATGPSQRLGLARPVLAADRRTPGRVYVGTEGLGILAGTLNGTTGGTSTITVQSESGTWGAGAGPSSGNGSINNGFVDFGGQNSWAEVAVSVPSAGTFSVEFRFANGSTGNRSCNIAVNGSTAGSTPFPPTGSWTTWSTVTLPNISLQSGNNTIRATANSGAGGPNLDQIRIVP